VDVAVALSVTVIIQRAKELLNTNSDETAGGGGMLSPEHDALYDRWFADGLLLSLSKLHGYRHSLAGQDCSRAVCAPAAVPGGTCIKDLQSWYRLQQPKTVASKRTVHVQATCAANSIPAKINLWQAVGRYTNQLATNICQTEGRVCHSVCVCGCL
jgi:hypothetical protein